MSDLTTYPIVQTAHNRRFTYVAFYTLPQGVNHFIDIPKGGEFGIVHTPIFRDDNWTYTRWKVTHQQCKRDIEPQRYYMVMAERVLTDNEREHFETIVCRAILWEIAKLYITPAPLSRPVKEREETT